ncbi:MAG: hypothetical protein K2X27_16175 [Candidatus Obscuribacterales bacterium]|nr:hypothetical protein [Candidatus Obscuribacterales bacterium]
MLIALWSALLFLSFASPSCMALGQKSSDSGLPFCAANAKLPQVTVSSVVAAPIDKVWTAIKKRRVSDSAHRQLLSYDGRTAVVREFFLSMPIIGNTSCVYAEYETRPGKQIDYKMVSSDHLHAFQGSWYLESGKDPNTTVVSLSSTIDPGVRFPLWRKIARVSLENSVKETIAEVSNLALAKDSLLANSK